MKPNKSYTQKNSFKRIINATKYSKQGIFQAFKTEAAFRQDLILFALNTIAVFFIHDKYFMAWLFFAGLFVIFSELINTVVEYVVDLVTSEHNPLAGSAKDMGSALVFLSIFNLVVSWLIYLFK